MLRVEQEDYSGDILDSSFAVRIAEGSFRPSILYSLLPAAVSNRIPTIPSLRRSIGETKSCASHSKSSSLTELLQPETPPPGYSSTPPSGTVTPQGLSAALNEAELDFADDISERPSSSRSSHPPIYDRQETSSGIRWKYASLGTSLLIQASRESSAPTASSNETSPALIRQLYIHGMTWLLRGLPAELTPEEMLSLQAALPQVLETQNNRDALALLPVSQSSPSPLRNPPRNPTMIHRITAAFVLQVFIVAQFLLPYIKLLLSHTYRFERKHQITKRLVSTGVATVDELGRRSLRLSQTVCRMNDGMVGQAINEMTIWWVTGVTGGLHQGLSEGLQAMKSSEPPRHAETVQRIG